MIGEEIFKLVLNKNYTMGFDLYDENNGNYSLGVITELKKQFEVRRTGKFLRVVDVGYSCVVKVVK